MSSDMKKSESMSSKLSKLFDKARKSGLLGSRNKTSAKVGRHGSAANRRRKKKLGLK